jgi:hypothetical protein
MDAPDPALAEVVALERRLLDPEVRARPEEVGRMLHAQAVPAAGPAARPPSLRSSIWVASAEGWRLLFHQGTRTGP